MASALTDLGSATVARGPRARAKGRAPATVPELLPEGSTPAGAGLVDAAPPADLVDGATAPDLLDAPLATELLADLDHPDLVLSEGYVGPERRASGRLARLRRVTFSQRRSLLTLEFAVMVVVAVVVAAVVLTGPAVRPGSARSLDTGRTDPSSRAARSGAPAGTTPTSAPAAPAAAAPATTAPPPTTPPTTVPTTAAPAPSGPLTPDQLGAQALAMVRYPWQQIPGYSIQFLPIADAPSPGFYGNTTFTWGHTGGASVLYVYPGETAQRLAAITAFEIGHEVDAAAVEPAGGEAQIENMLGYHPASWAPNCDCAEQNFLSGWYAAAFSNYWSPGVGAWSQLPVAPPTGATLNQMAAWLNPTIP